MPNLFCRIIYFLSHLAAILYLIKEAENEPQVRVGLLSQLAIFCDFYITFFCLRTRSLSSQSRLDFLFLKIK